MVNDLSLMGRQIEMTVYFIVVERADAGCAQPQCLSGEVHPLANGAGLKMHIAISTVTVDVSGSIEIANHREGYARVAGQILSETESRCSNALVAAH
jgi:hypothetical protein